MNTLSVYALFHLNLAFSSIEENRRAEVIARCYWPLLDLAQRFPIAIEASGFTLETIASLDADWIDVLAALMREGHVEFIGSGYAQLIGPLVPAMVNRENLRLGQSVYGRLLGVKPSLALVSEQAYSAGLVPLYAAAGYRALIMDYDNCAHHHPEWPRSVRYAPQKVIGAADTVLDLLWTNTVAFQKAQRLAHGEIDVAAYADYIAAQQGKTPRAFPLYGNDAEVFDFRPGRLHTEAPLGAREWEKLETGFTAVRALGNIEFVLPSTLLDRDFSERICGPLRLETARCPIPVKKQHKYNVTRWAVTGRDDLDINTRCHRLYESLTQGDGGDGDWQTLCRLWSSDFRTHITEPRWQGFLAELADCETRLLRSIVHDVKPRLAPRINSSKAVPDGAFLDIETPTVRVRLNTRRGLAIDALWLGDLANRTAIPICRTLPHGYFDDVLLAFDWYSGTVIYDRPAMPKITDLAPAQPTIRIELDGTVTIEAKIETPIGPVRKKIAVAADRPAVDYDIELDWSEWGKGSLRIGNFTLNPEAFACNRLSTRTHNGGATPDRFALSGTIDHGAPVSLQVSASCALGMTEGFLDIGDETNRLAINVDKAAAALVGMVTVRPVADSTFCRVSLSALEFDDTRKPATQAGRRHFRFSLGKAA